MVALFKTVIWSDRFDKLNGGSLFVDFRLGSAQWKAKDLIALEADMQQELKEHPFPSFLKALHVRGTVVFNFTSPTAQMPTHIWVQQQSPDCKLSAVQLCASPLNDIEGLKDAIKAKKSSLRDVDADLPHHQHEAPRWAAVAPDAPLKANTPYGFVPP